jgi:CRP/FNR family transcriptional regulator, cyclic AMP receptor protein
MAYIYILQQVDIFEDLSPEQLGFVDKICIEKNYNQGELIFEENSPSREFYIIVDGEVEIQVDPDTIGDGTNSYQPTTIATLRRGQSFGEVAIIDPGVRSASAKCGSETCRLLMINREDFLLLLENDYKMGFIVMRNFAADLSLKIRQTNLMIRESLM